jgi:prepilin-type N-terminal cleavage/methylation domain-containing protein
MAKPTAQKGMTLIEILLALIVMGLGVLGILALFPPAMESAKESVEETNAAIVGESVAQGLTTAVRLAAWDPAATNTICALTHDLQIGSIRMKYRFVLPKIQTSSDPVWMHFPGSTSPSDPDSGMQLPSPYDPEGDARLFMLAGDGWVKQTTDNVKQVNDPTDSYNQFAFSFDVRKVFTQEYLLKPTPQPNPDKQGANYTYQDVDPMMKLYEFRIYVFRTAQQLNSISTGGGGGGGGGGTSVMPGPGPGGGTAIRNLVGVLSKRIAAQ